MNGNDGHNPLEAILGAMQSMGMQPSDLNQMAALLDPILGKGKGVPTPAQIRQLQFFDFDMAQVPNITLGEFGLHWLAEHRGYGDPVHPREIVKWSEREDPIFLDQLSPSLWTWTFPCHNENEFRIVAKMAEQWGSGTFKALTQDEIDAWWDTYQLDEGWHDLRPSSPAKGAMSGMYEPLMGKVLVDKTGIPQKVQWFKDGNRHAFKDCVAVASALTGYDIQCNTRYDDKKKTTKLVKGVTRRDPPMQHPNGKPA